MFDQSTDLCRRQSMPMFKIVEAGIAFGNVDVGAGAKYMACHGVPLAVARRVLLHPGQRRSAS